jgi:hypothetical protein
MSRILCSLPGELLHREYDAGGNAARCQDVEHIASYPAIRAVYLHMAYLLRL